MSLHSAPTPFSSMRATRAGALRAHGLGVIFLRAGRYAACFQGRDAAHELTWDLCGKSHLFQPGTKVGQRSETWKQKRANMRASGSTRASVRARVCACVRVRVRARSLMATLPGGGPDEDGSELRISFSSTLSITLA